jgi:hypothetical protein
MLKSFQTRYLQVLHQQRQYQDFVQEKAMLQAPFWVQARHQVSRVHRAQARSIPTPAQAAFMAQETHASLLGVVLGQQLLCRR